VAQGIISGGRALRNCPVRFGCVAVRLCRLAPYLQLHRFVLARFGSGSGICGRLGRSMKNGLSLPNSYRRDDEALANFPGQGLEGEHNSIDVFRMESKCVGDGFRKRRPVDTHSREHKNEALEGKRKSSAEF
jgi:hypothetical protein